MTTPFIESSIANYESLKNLPADYPGKATLLTRAAFQIEYLMFNDMILAAESAIAEYEDYTPSEVSINMVDIRKDEDGDWVFVSDGAVFSAVRDVNIEDYNIYNTFVVDKIYDHDERIEKLKDLYQKVCN